jgi:NTP pyrophosphatase (non-canonical NTP hydrolase)
MSNLHLKPDPTLADIQQYVIDMEKGRGFTQQTLLEVWVLLSEEIGELAKCVRKTATSMNTDAAKHYDFDAAGEFADIIIVLCAVANRLGVDLEQAFRDKEEQNKQRVWK